MSIRARLPGYLDEGDKPGHDIIGHGGCGYASRRVGLHALQRESVLSFDDDGREESPDLEITHQTTPSSSRHIDGLRTEAGWRVERVG